VMRRAVVISVVLLVVAAAPAGALIVVQRSIAGVKLGMTAKQVRGVLGKPDAVSYPKDPIQGTVKRYRYGLTEVFIARGNDGRVYAITTRSTRQRTSDGVGVGSSEAAVHAHVDGVHCEGSGSTRICQVGKALPGHRVTTFFISKAGKVKRVSLGFVID
jgi:hypothetical protein